jgi:hypothetical protein
MPNNRWTNLAAPANGYAVDANFWNSLTAPGRNLDYLYESQYKSDAYLELSATQNINAGTTFATISWNSVINQTDLAMWNISAPSVINFSTDDGGSTNDKGLWGINLTYSYNAATTQTDRRTRFAFNLGGATPINIDDAYEDTGNNGAQHTFFVPWLSGKLQPQDYLQIQVRHNSTTTPRTITANIRVTRIPSPVNNFDYNIL